MERAVPLTWGETNNLQWRVDLPDRGNSTPIVWGHHVFITQALAKENWRAVFAFDLRTGKELWRGGTSSEGREPTNRQNPYCSASPATDGERVVAFFGDPGLYCYDFTGKELWHRSLGAIDSWHGSGSSPVIQDGLCFLNFGPGSEAAVYAIDMNSGETVWKVDAPQVPSRFGAFPSRALTGAPGLTVRSAGTAPKPADFQYAGMAGDFSGKGGNNGSWCTPVVLGAGDQGELVVVESSQVTAYGLRTGERRWTCKRLPDQVFASPAVGEGVLVAMGHVSPVGIKVVAIKLEGKGDVTDTHRLWEVNLRKECIGSGVVAGGHVFLITDGGFGVCLDLRTGKEIWEVRLLTLGGSWSSLVQVNDRLMAANLLGEVAVVAASPRFELLNRNTIGNETTCSSLAVASGHVLLRTHDALWCFGSTSQAGR